MSGFSKYEENMIGFLMGHGMSREDAERSSLTIMLRGSNMNQASRKKCWKT